jgi:predicted TIM-barrel enzyme
MNAFTREQCLERLRAQVAAGRPIIGGGAGTGLSAKCAEAGGIDLIIIYNSGRFCGTDPFRIMKRFLREVRDAGFSGVQNFPTVGLIDGTFRQGLEETDMGFDKEVEMIAAAAELGLLTCPYVFTEDEARAMARAGADVLIPHIGLTTKGLIGARTAMTLEQAAARVQALADAAHAVKPDALVLCHGGPIAEPDDAAYVLAHTRGVVGFFGASSIERLPTEIAITSCVRRFKAIGK